MLRFTLVYDPRGDETGPDRVWDVFDDDDVYMGEVAMPIEERGWVFVGSSNRGMGESTLFQLWAFLRHLMNEDKAEAAPPKPADLTVVDEEKLRRKGV